MAISLKKVHEMFPNWSLGEDDEGQLVVYTGFYPVSDRTDTEYDTWENLTEERRDELEGHR